MDADRPLPAPFTPNLSHLSNFDPTLENPRKRYPHADEKTASFPRALTQTRNNAENVLADVNPRKDRPFAFPSRPFASRQSVVNPTKTHNEGKARKIFMLQSEKANQPPKSSVFKFPTSSPSNIARLRHDYSPNAKEELSSCIGTNSSPVQSPHRSSPRPLALQAAYSEPFRGQGGDTRLPETAERHVPPQSSTPSLPSSSAIMIAGGGGGFPDIAIKALAESKKVMEDLIQQKSYTNSLLASQKATNERLADALRDCASAKEELSATRSNLSSKQAELTSVQALLSQAREDLLTVKAEIARMEQEFSQYRNDTVMARTAIEEEKAEKFELRKKLSNVKHKLMGLSEDYTAFREGQLDLKSSHETLKLTLERTLRELLELNRTTGDGLASTRPFIIEGGHLAQANQLKDVISELQDSLMEAHRVTDLLRDKLHHTLGQLAESMAKVSELEHERKQGWNERVVLGRNLDRFETKFEELTGRIIKREEESVEALAEAAVAEAKASTAVEKLHETQITLKKKEEELNELVDVQNENAKLQVQLGSAERKSSEISEKLLETENALRCQEKEIIALQSELKLLKSSREELRLSLNESEAIAQRSKEELASMIFKETLATKKNDAMEIELSRMKNEIIHLNECVRQSNSQLGIVQDRFDSQAVTLRLAKEDSGDLQERLFQRETIFASKIGALEIDLAVSREQKLTLETQLGELREELKKQRAAFVDASADFEKQLAKQEATSSRFLEIQEQRANRAEGDAAETKQRLVEIQSRVEVAEAAKLQMEGCVEAHSARLENEIAASKRLTEEMTTLKEEVMALRRSNAEFVQRTQDLKYRYDSGDLTDDEKEFVTALITATQSIHEQDTVSRCNELRRSENMIQTLQARIRTLESTLARVLKEKEEAGPESKPMVDLRSWISSSPPDAGTAIPHDKTSVANAEIGAVSSGDPAPVVPLPPTTTPEPQFNAVTRAQLRTEPIPPSPPLTIAPRFTMLSGMDTDDDAPLSEPPMSPAIALGKRDRVGSPTKNEDSRRSGRRVKGPATRASGPPLGDNAQSSRPNQKKPAAEPSAKPRARKRK